MRLEGVSLLVECVLWLIVGDALSGSYSLNHLARLGILYGFGFVLVIVFWEWEGDDGV
jgi:hypothetical protein